MNKRCPNCHSKDIYRRHPHSLEMQCDRCYRTWKAAQVAAPILQDKFWLSEPLKGWHYIEVWRSPTNPQKFACRRAYSASLFGELHGEFDTPELALQAGIEEAKKLPVSIHVNEFDKLKQTARNYYVAGRKKSKSEAEDQQIYAAYLLELESIQRLELQSKIRESEP